MHRNMKKFDIFVWVVGIGGLVLLTHWLDPSIFQFIHKITGLTIRSTWSRWIDRGALISLAGILIAWLIVHRDSRLSKWLEAGSRQVINYLVNVFTQVINRLVIFRNRHEFSEAAPLNWRLNWKDGIILGSFLIASLLLYLSDIQGSYPNPVLASNSANIASFAAAVENPDLFQKDELLSNPQNLLSYSTINIPILNLLKSWTGNYGMAFAVLIPIQTFINLVGFYLLGIALIGNRAWAVLLAYLLSLPFEMNLLETWGIRLDPVSRFTFQAVLPFILVLAIRWRGNPKLWPLLVAFSGVMAFIHPVSTPVWAFAIWLGLWGSIPKEWSLLRRWVVMVGLGLLTVVALIPYTMNYLSGHIQGKGPDYDLLLTTIANEFPHNILNIPGAFGDFLRITLSVGLLPVFIFFGGALIFLQWKNRWKVNLILLWTAGILFVSLVIPWIEHAIEAAYHIAPIETELVRGLRYLVFVMLLVCVMGAFEIFRRFRNPQRWIFGGLAVLLAVGWGYQSDFQVLRIDRFADCLKQGRLVCAEISDEARAIQAVRDLTPPGSAIFTTFSNDSKMSFSLPVRYEALRSLVYSYKDRGQLVISNSSVLDQWAERRTIVDTINGKKISPSEKIILFKTDVQDWGTDYILTDLPADKTQLEAAGMQVVYQNDSYILIKIR